MEEVEPKPDENDENFGLHMVNAFDVSDEHISNRKVCVVDSGYDTKNLHLPKTKLDGWSPNGWGNNWNKDDHGHGTHVKLAD